MKTIRIPKSINAHVDGDHLVVDVDELVTALDDADAEVLHDRLAGRTDERIDRLVDAIELTDEERRHTSAIQFCHAVRQRTGCTLQVAYRIWRRVDGLRRLQEG